MEQLITFAVDEIQKIDMSDYSDAEFAVARVGFLSTRPNSHGYNISEEVDEPIEQDDSNDVLGILFLLN